MKSLEEEKLVGSDNLKESSAIDSASRALVNGKAKAIDKPVKKSEKLDCKKRASPKYCRRADIGSNSQGYSETEKNNINQTTTDPQQANAFGETSTKQGTKLSKKNALTFVEAANLLEKEENKVQSSEKRQIVFLKDKSLITEFVYHSMKQTRFCQFSESDAIAGGRRNRNIMKDGFGGLECIHCAESSVPRRFFSSCVDTFANSFAVVPTHIFDCEFCPSHIKEALLVLKQSHVEERVKRPTGSQKLFLCQMWERIHSIYTPEPLVEKNEDNRVYFGVLI